MLKRLWIVVAVLLSAAHAHAQDTTYEIRLERPQRVGDRARVSNTTETRDIQRVNGQVTSSTSRTGEIEAEVLIVAVDADGNATEERYTITRLDFKDEGVQRRLVSEPTQVVRRTGEEITYEVHGTEAHGTMLEALELLLGSNADEPDEDAVFGTREPRSVGESWPVNARLLADEFNASGELGIDPDDVDGTMTLVARGERGGIDCLQVRCEIEIDDVLPDGGPIPPGAESAIRIELDGWLPVDLELPAHELSSELHLEAEFTIEQPDGSSMDISITSDRWETERTVLLERGD